MDFTLNLMRRVLTLYKNGNTLATFSLPTKFERLNQEYHTYQTLIE